MTLQPVPRVTIIVPCFNEQSAIEETISSIEAAIGERQGFDIIVVDDGSTDASPDVLARLKATRQDLKVYRHDTNLGYGAALKTGIRTARGEWIVITDADGTYPNGRIPNLLEHMEDADMVVGASTGESVVYSPIRRIPKVLLARYCSWIARRPIPDINSGLRAFKKSVVERFLHVLPDSFSFTTTVTLALMTNHYLVKYVPVDYAARTGKSKIRPIRDTLRFVQLILRMGMYFAPIRTFIPFIIVFGVTFLGCLAHDVFIERNITDKTLVFLMLTINTSMFVLLADLIDKRLDR